MYFVNMLPVLYRPALFYLWVVVSYHGSCGSMYCSILVLSGVYTVLFSEGPVLWVGRSGVLLVFFGLPPCAGYFRYLIRGLVYRLSSVLLLFFG